jgi:hypothetical protein
LELQDFDYAKAFFHLKIKIQNSSEELDHSTRMLKKKYISPRQIFISIEKKKKQRRKMGQNQ